MKSKRKGVSLIEALFVLGIMAILLGMVMILLSQNNESNLDNENTEEIEQIINMVHDLYSSSSNYDGLSPQTVPLSAYLKNSYVIGKNLYSPYSTGINFFPTGVNNSEMEIVEKIPFTGCMKLLSSDFGSSFVSGSTDASGSLNNPETPTNAIAKCGGYGTKTIDILLVFR